MMFLPILAMHQMIRTTSHLYLTYPPQVMTKPSREIQAFRGEMILIIQTCQYLQEHLMRTSAWLHQKHMRK